MKNIILTLLITLSFIGLQAQEVTRSLLHLGNKFEVKIEHSKNNLFMVYITNTTNDGSAKNKSISNTFTEAEFQKWVAKEFDKLIKNYTFSTKTIQSLQLSKEQVNELDKITDDIYKNFTPVKDTLVVRFKKDVEYGSFNDFKIKIDNGDYKKGKNSYYLIDKKDSKYYINIDTLNFTNEKEFFEQLNIATSKDTAKIYKHLYPKEELKKAVNKEFSKVNFQKTAALHKGSFKNDGFQFIGNYSAEDATKVVYATEILQEAKNKFFTLRFCSNKEDTACINTIKLDFDVSKEKLKSVINESLNPDITEEEHIVLYLKCQTLNNDVYDKVIKAPVQKEVDSLINLIENERTKYSGILKLNSEAKIYKKPKTENFTLISIEDTNKKFIPAYASVRFFNKRANNIVLVGNVVDSSGEVIQEQVSVNFQWSIPIRSFNSNLNSISIVDSKGKTIGHINYNEVFQYYPYEEKFNYAVKNKEYRVTANDSVKIEQRKLANYFNPIIFSDFLGLTPGSENGLLFAEGRVNIPMWIFNVRKTSFFTALRADINLSLYNGFNDTSRAITKTSTTAINLANPVDVNLFDHVKFANVMAGISLDVFNLELKGLSTDISLGGGVRYYRAALNHTQTNTTGADIITTDQLNALAPELNINFQIRPQTNFGADLNLSYSWLNARGSRNDTPINILGDTKDKRMFRLNLDIFSKINPDNSNGGVYGRIGGFYSIASKDFYPQIMVGYATNLSSFVNKFKK